MLRAMGPGALPPTPHEGDSPGALTSHAGAALRGLYHVFAALLRCWPLLLPPVLLTTLAACTEQGRDAIVATASLAAIVGPGYHAYAAQALATVLVTLAALILLAPPRDASPEQRYAAHFVPGLVGLLAGYLPLMAFDLYGLNQGEAGSWMTLSRMVPPIFVVLARDVLPHVRAGSPPDVIGPVFLLGLVLSIAFILTNSPFVVFGAAVLVFVGTDLWLARAVQPDRRYVQHGVLVLLALFAIGGGLLVALDPAGWGMAMGTYATLIVALSAWLAFGILLWRIGLRSGALGGIAAVTLTGLFLTGPFGLGEVRRLDDRADPMGGIEAHARAWLGARRSEIEATRGPYPVFLVTADGGGIRAAWWTATLLGAIQDEAPGFARQVFAMSGVSGGSLGVATFAAQAAQLADAGTGTPGRACAGRDWRGCAEAVLGADLLAPAVAAMLTVDAPRSILRTRLLPDRAAAHEEGFESAWRRAAGTDLYAEGLLALWRGGRRHAVPLLLLNTTEATTGRRLVLAPVTFGAADGERGDLAPLLGGRDLRLSTAVLLSARFPGVSPAGWVPTSDGGAGYAIVDGGYADNSGARSAIEVLAALRNAARAEGLEGRIRPVAIMIANDPLPTAPVPDVPGPSARKEVSTLGSLLAPVLTLDRLRQANTQRAKQAYVQAICAAGGIVLDGFDLRAGPTAFPLGWMLAQATRDAMAEQQRRMQHDAGSHLRQAMQLALEPSRWINDSQTRRCTAR